MEKKKSKYAIFAPWRNGIQKSTLLLYLIPQASSWDRDCQETQ